MQICTLFFDSNFSELQAQHKDEVEGDQQVRHLKVLLVPVNKRYCKPKDVFCLLALESGSWISQPVTK